MSQVMNHEFDLAMIFPLPLDIVLFIKFACGLNQEGSDKHDVFAVLVTGLPVAAAAIVSPLGLMVIGCQSSSSCVGIESFLLQILCRS